MLLTMQDLDAIEKVVGEQIEERTKNLPTKDEFFNKMDEVVGELKTTREEHAVLSNRVYDNHQPRIGKKLNIEPAV